MAEPIVREARIDAVARYLRETTQAGKNLTPWKETPNSAKRKWRRLAEGALDVMQAARPSARDGGEDRV